MLRMCSASTSNVTTAAASTPSTLSTLRHTPLTQARAPWRRSVAYSCLRRVAVARAKPRPSFHMLRDFWMHDSCPAIPGALRSQESRESTVCERWGARSVGGLAPAICLGADHAQTKLHRSGGHVAVHLIAEPSAAEEEESSGCGGACEGRLGSVGAGG